MINSNSFEETKKRTPTTEILPSRIAFHIDSIERKYPKRETAT